MCVKVSHFVNVYENLCKYVCVTMSCDDEIVNVLMCILCDCVFVTIKIGEYFVKCMLNTCDKN